MSLAGLAEIEHRLDAIAVEPTLRAAVADLCEARSVVLHPPENSSGYVALKAGTDQCIGLYVHRNHISAHMAREAARAFFDRGFPHDRPEIADSARETDFVRVEPSDLRDRRKDAIKVLEAALDDSATRSGMGATDRASSLHRDEFRCAVCGLSKVAHLRVDEGRDVCVDCEG